MALDCPPEILQEQPTVPGLAISCLHHRRRASTMTLRTMRRIEALTHLTRLTLEGLLTGIAPQPQRTLIRDPIGLDGDPAQSRAGYGNAGISATGRSATLSASSNRLASS